MASPHALVAALVHDPRPITFSLTCERLPATVRTHGRDATTAELRRAILSTQDRAVTTWLLDAATLHRLTPLDPGEACAIATGPVLWRYLDALGEPVDADPGSPYEKLMLDVLHDDIALPVATPATGPTVAQSMLIGGTARPGEGASGGLTVFLASLAGALVRRQDIGRVVTVVLAPEPTAVTVRKDPELDHWTVHVPVDSPVAPAQPDMARHRAGITWWLTRLLRQCGLSPDVVHVRYSDDGSLAVADAARLLGAKLVFTVTPDPHRHLAERHLEDTADLAAMRFDLHRVHVADHLVERADQVITIGGRQDEVLAHFPRLDPAALCALEEGIAPSPAPTGRALVRELFAPAVLPRLDASAEGLPVLLNVGRLHPMKQQPLLVRAWLEAGLHRSTALVIIGGSSTARTPDEQAVLDEVLELSRSAPSARGRLAVLSAWSNHDIRRLQHELAATPPSSGAPHVYACASAKEEFGIAVLEAMEAGLLAVGPQRGGLRCYIDQGRNGFLIDTSTSRSLGEGLAQAAGLGPATARIAAAGQRTVRERFHIDAVADPFAALYRRLSVTPSS
ncbi:glycosyltransferase family 4 protein [Lentzea californiensis]|uniref:glycosyltransferase family 4 protein n=1 Tax=Lentzea californiensis TaxID=438851 RepID=UPI002166BB70|nr:glycosyltransferase family 4 protein [Lentzea californiensis]MCR3750676.1 D-inositol-3-phosphate glycosyltransferase [Lentzea californiensis]